MHASHDMHNEIKQRKSESISIYTHKNIRKILKDLRFDRSEKPSVAFLSCGSLNLSPIYKQY